MYSKLFDFISSSPSAYHTVDTVRSILDREGYTRLYEADGAPIVAGGKYYIIRNGTSIIAFRVPSSPRGFMIAASHSDSPAFRLKLTAEQRGAYTRLECEKYGGMIYYSWLDRPLSLAGRVLLSTEKGIEERLVDLARDIAVIPSVAIHLNRGVNDGCKLNPAVDLLPLYSDGEGKGIMAEIAEAASTSADKIIFHDLFLYNREGGRLFGADNKYILAPRLDDLGCVFTSLYAFIGANDSDSCPVLAVFDNEEVGSQTKQGAASTFLENTLRRIAGDRYDLMLESSLMVSADNAHAKHPNHPELSDADNAPVLGGGVVIKYNASQRYATDGYSAALFMQICKSRGVKVQSYYNRADIPGGSTLGSISDTLVSIPTVDIGLGQLAMHSASETMGASDIDEMIGALTAFYSASLLRHGSCTDLIFKET